MEIHFQSYNSLKKKSQRLLTSVGSEASGMNPHIVKMCIVVAQISTSLGKKMGHRMLWDKNDKKMIQTVISNNKSQALWCYGIVFANGKAHLHLCDGSINAEDDTEIVEQHMLTLRWHFFQGHPWIFKEHNTKTTFCTHCKSMNVEEECLGTGQASVLVSVRADVWSQKH